MKLWQKNTVLDPRIERFTVGDDPLLDGKLVRFDCEASVAHARMLGKIGVLKPGEVRRLVSGLKEIIRLDAEGKFPIRQEDEDCHTAIENRLTRILGNLGKKIHTARSRNDQVLAALRLYYKEALSACDRAALSYIRGLKRFKSGYGRIRLPGYTHTRKAMASTVGLWAGAFIESMEDDRRLLRFASEWLDQCPLGTGAGYGVPLHVDRSFTAKLLGFKRVQRNPMYVQNSRGKFESLMVHAMVQVLLDLNRAASDLIFFSMPEFGYFVLPKTFCTGSSIMPQKKNPDVLEVLRAKYHVVISYEFQVKNIIGNLLSGYNRDLQLTKMPTMKGLEITKESLSVADLIFKNLKVNEENCRKALTKDIYAAEEAHRLVRRGVPFREAYKRISKRY